MDRIAQFKTHIQNFRDQKEAEKMNPNLKLESTILETESKIVEVNSNPVLPPPINSANKLRLLDQLCNLYNRQSSMPWARNSIQMEIDQVRGKLDWYNGNR